MNLYLREKILIQPLFLLLLSLWSHFFRFKYVARYKRGQFGVKIEILAKLNSEGMSKKKQTKNRDSEVMLLYGAQIVGILPFRKLKLINFEI